MACAPEVGVRDRSESSDVGIDEPSTQATASEQTGTDLGVVSDRMDAATRQHLLDAADLALQRHPGAIGELLRQELLSWMIFGLHLGSELIMRVADDLHARSDRAMSQDPRGG